MTLQHSETTVYRAFDVSGRLLYVGIATDIFARLGQHSMGSVWGSWCTTITLEEFPNRKEALAAETEAIRGEDPIFNQAGRPWERFLKWGLAYPLRSADDVSDEELMNALRVTHDYTKRVEALRASVA